MSRTLSALSLSVSIGLFPALALSAPADGPPRGPRAPIAPVLLEGAEAPAPRAVHVATAEEVARAEAEVPPDERADAFGDPYPVALEPGDAGYEDAIRAFAGRGAAPGDDSLLLDSFGDDLDAGDHPDLPDDEEGDPGALQRFAATLDDVASLVDGADGRPAEDASVAVAGMGIAVGRAGGGRLIKGIQFPLDHEGVTVASPRNAYGTADTVDGIIRAVDTVRARFPDTPDLALGDISAPRGGRLRPHRSHQNGLDVDIGFYYLDAADSRRFAEANGHNLDVDRTFALIEAFIDLGNVQYMFLDYRLQKLLYEYGRDELGYPEDLLDAWFQYPDGYRDRSAVVRHVRGHGDHLHVRFGCPEAQDTCHD